MIRKCSTVIAHLILLHFFVVGRICYCFSVHNSFGRAAWSSQAANGWLKYFKRKIEDWETFQKFGGNWDRHIHDTQFLGLLGCGSKALIFQMMAISLLIILALFLITDSAPVLVPDTGCHQVDLKTPIFSIIPSFLLKDKELSCVL